MELIRKYLRKCGFEKKVDGFCVYYEKENKRVYLDEFETCYRLTHYRDSSKVPRIIFELDKDVDTFDKIEQLGYFGEVIEI